MYLSIYLSYILLLETGFYEWKAAGSKEKGGGAKQPYLVYAPQADGARIESLSACTADNAYDETAGGWTGPKPLFMAGIYSEWRGGADWKQGDPPVYSYSVLTR